MAKKKTTKKTTKKKTTTKKPSAKTSKKKTTTKKKPTASKKKTTSPKRKSKKSTKKAPSKRKSQKLPDAPVEVEVITTGEEFEEEQELNAQELEKLEKWWLQEPFRSLLDPELAKTVDFREFDLSALIQEFTDRMLKEELIDFRISGLAIYSSAKLYHQKITDVIKEEEDIEREQARERLRREIPGQISQPLREARKLATTEELFGAMRRAIIETMQKREKLRIRRERIQAKREKQVKKKSRAKLPAEILKHISGREETVEQLLNRWHQKLKTMASLSSDNLVSSADIKTMLYEGDETLFEKKVKYIDCFSSLLFLTSLNRIRMEQRTMKTPIQIEITDRKAIEF